jgi:carbamoyl-phosphate synthase small subunit
MALGRLVMADGTIFRGRSVGAEGSTVGEAVFNTGMTGYQEVLTDPSYRGQIVTMTYPEIGNYGVSDFDVESERPQVAGFVMRRLCERHSNFRASEDLGAYLKRLGIVAIDEVDTRAITRRLREAGSANAVISSDESLSDEELVERARAAPDMSGQDLASGAGCQSAYEWTEISDPAQFGTLVTWPRLNDPLVVCIDYGIKRNILRLLRSCGLRLQVVPASASAETILAMEPDGIFLSNGPGDPSVVRGAADTVAELARTGIPMFGICLGHQILALALGAKSFKLKFGHRGANHPIQRLEDGAVEIASHNHGFAVDADSLPDDLELTHLNLNDRTCAGIRHRSLPIFSVQYHPEAAPGPSDPLYLFQRFVDLIEKHRSRRSA